MLEKRIKELQQQLRDAVSHAEEEPIGQDGPPDLELYVPLTTSFTPSHIYQFTLVSTLLLSTPASLLPLSDEPLP